jgi:uncharacterized protein
MQTVTILSVDGGGIRGLIPARILVEIEKLTKLPTHSLFDFIAGTSTGGIIALSLVRPAEPGSRRAKFSASDLVELYLRHGPAIFSRSPWHWLRTLGGITGPKYDGLEFDRVLREYLGEYRLHQALTNVMVTAYDTEGPAAAFFKSWRALVPEEGFDDSGDRALNRFDFRMREVARATSSAPTYFPPLRLLDLARAGRPMSLLDGGLFAANPGMCALADAQRLYPGAELFVVSLGTGNGQLRLSWDKTKAWGLIGWARPIIDVMLDGVSDTVEYELSAFLPTSHAGAHHRLQVQLPSASQAMDDASPENMTQLLGLADRLIEDDGPRLEAICSALTNAQSRRPRS